MNLHHFNQLLSERLETFRNLSETALYPEVKERADDCIEVLEQVVRDFQMCSYEEPEMVKKSFTMKRYAKTLGDYNGKKGFKRVGNHTVELWSILPYTVYLDDATGKWRRVDNPTRIFRYHDNPVCIVRDSTKRFWLSHAGCFTTSTTQAVNSYRAYFSGLGYTCMTSI